VESALAGMLRDTSTRAQTVLSGETKLDGRCPRDGPPWHDAHCRWAMATRGSRPHAGCLFRESVGRSVAQAKVEKPRRTGLTCELTIREFSRRVTRTQARA
jgi:hypothetical protein